MSVIADESHEVNARDRLQIADVETNNISYINHLSIIINEFSDRTFRITNLYLCGLFISIVLHILDVGTDLYLAYQYYEHEQTIYFMLTLCFVIFPAFISSMISLRMYIVDTEPATWVQWVFRSLSITLQFSTVVRYVEALQCGFKLKNKQEDNSLRYEKYYKPLLKEDSNLSLLRVIECFLEAAPQQVLQIAILLQLERQNINYFLQIYQYMTISSSLISIAWSFAIYNRSVRFAREDKRKMSWTGSFLQFAWLFLVTSARILALSEIASVFPKITFFACIIHWLIMTFWLAILERTWFCHSSSNKKFKTIETSMEFFFCAVLGMVYIFAFLTPSDGQTRYKYIFYYLICFVENTVAILTWSICGNANVAKFWWYVPLLLTTFIMFLLGLILMLIYYTFYHPEIGLIRKAGVCKKQSNELEGLKKTYYTTGTQTE